MLKKETLYRQSVLLFIFNKFWKNPKFLEKIFMNFQKKIQNVQNFQDFSEIFKEPRANEKLSAQRQFRNTSKSRLLALLLSARLPIPAMKCCPQSRIAYCDFWSKFSMVAIDLTFSAVFADNGEVIA